MSIEQNRGSFFVTIFKWRHVKMFQTMQISRKYYCMEQNDYQDMAQFFSCIT